MARIIEVGNITKVARCTCHKCGSKIEFEGSDVTSDQRGQAHVRCPVCSSYIDSSVLKWKKVAARG